jgi:hypothetical protein
MRVQPKKQGKLFLFGKVSLKCSDDVPQNKRENQRPVQADGNPLEDLLPVVHFPVFEENGTDQEAGKAAECVARVAGRAVFLKVEHLQIQVLSAMQKMENSRMLLFCQVGRGCQLDHRVSIPSDPVMCKPGQ